jgi:uncharacterized protein YjaG (DUF416 family)
MKAPMIKFNELAMRRSLEGLSEPKQLAFMLLLCERMMPGLQKFSTDTNFRVSRYRECLENGWLSLDDQPYSSKHEEASEECFKNAPDTEKFDHPLTSAALNAALSIGLLMRFLSEGNVNHIVEAAGLARDTMALYVQANEAIPPHSLGPKEIMKHPLVQQELERQAEDLEFLASLPEDARRKTVHQIKERANRAAGLPTTP